MRNLITGGAGFIGSHLARYLLERGEGVRVLDIRDMSHLPREAETVQGSILDASTVASALNGVRRLYHLAANPNLWAADKKTFEECNLRGTEIVLTAAAKAGLECIVHTSTESVLRGGRRAQNGLVINEETGLTVEDMPGPYCRSKFLAERRALEAARKDGLPVVVVNPTLPVGPGDHLVTPPTGMLLHFLNGHSRFYLDCTLNMVDVRDAARGHVLAAERGRPGERYILGGENIRLRDLLETLARMTGLPMPTTPIPYWLAFAVGAVSEFIADRITHRPPVAPLTGVRLVHTPMAFDSTKAARELGFDSGAVVNALQDEILWLDAQGLLTRRPKLPLAQNPPVGQNLGS